MRRWVDVIAALVAAAGLARLAIILPSRVTLSDFTHYYIASEELLATGHAYTMDLAPLFERHGFYRPPEVTRITAPNPPLFLWLFAPITLLSPGFGFAVWVAVEAVCLVVVLWLTRQLLREELSARAWRGLCAGVLASDVLLQHVGYAQMGLLLAALLLGGLALLRSGRGAVAIVPVVVAGMLKLFPFAVLPWFVWRGATTWPGRLKLGLLAVGVMAGIVVATGIGLWVEFLREGLPVLKGLAIGSLKNTTIPSWIINLGYAAYDLAPPAPVVRGLWIAGSAVGALLIATAVALSVRAHGDEAAQFALVTVATVAGGLTAWPHYFVLLIFPVAVVVARVLAAPTRLRVVGLAALLAMLNVFDPVVGPFWQQHRVLQILVRSTPQYGLLALGVFLGREVWRQRTR